MSVADEDRVNPGEMYQAGLADGIQEGIDLASRLHGAWTEAGSGNGLRRGAAIIAYLLKARKKEVDGGVGVHTRGEGGTGTSGDSSRVDGGRPDGAVDEGVLAVGDGSGGDLPSGGSARSAWPTPEERLRRIRAILNRPEEPDNFHQNGFASQYEALADLYDEDFASELREAVEG